MGDFYDRTFKAVFKYPIIVRELIESFIDNKRLLKHIKWETLRPLDAEMIAGCLAWSEANATTEDEFCKRIMDCVWQVECDNGLIQIPIIFEFQRRPEYFMPLRY